MVRIAEMISIAGTRSIVGMMSIAEGVFAKVSETGSGSRHVGDTLGTFICSI